MGLWRVGDGYTVPAAKTLRSPELLANHSMISRVRQPKGYISSLIIRPPPLPYRWAARRHRHHVHAKAAAAHL